MAEGWWRGGGRGHIQVQRRSCEEPVGGVTGQGSGESVWAAALVEVVLVERKATAADENDACGESTESQTKAKASGISPDFVCPTTSRRRKRDRYTTHARCVGSLRGLGTGLSYELHSFASCERRCCTGSPRPKVPFSNALLCHTAIIEPPPRQKRGCTSHERMTVERNIAI